MTSHRTMAPGPRPPRAGARRWLLLVLALFAAGCQPAQHGDPISAATAAGDFLERLRDGDAQGAWRLLTVPTRAARYDDDFTRFAEDVAGAEWGAARWRPGPVTDPEISWGVHVEFDSAIPDFLINGGIASPWDDEGVIILVQMTGPETYLIAGPGLDLDLR